MFAAPSKGEFLAAGITFPVVTLVAILLRVFVRRSRKLPLLADDWLTVPAWLCTTGVCATLIYATVHDILTTDNEPAAEPLNGKQRQFAAVTATLPILWIVANVCIKLSILCLYRRIFMGTTFTIASIATIVVTVLWTIFAFIGWLLFCGTNIRANFQGPWAVCPNWGWHVQIAVYVWDPCIDLILLLLPIPCLLHLQMKTRRKLALVVVFLIGSGAFAASVVNAVITILELNSDLFEGVQNSPDIVYYWQTVEIGLGLLLSNLPSLSPLLASGSMSSCCSFSRRSAARGLSQSSDEATLRERQPSKSLSKDSVSVATRQQSHSDAPQSSEIAVTELPRIEMLSRGDVTTTLIGATWL